MADIIYPQLSYDIQGACFEVHNDLRHFDLSEARLGDGAGNRFAGARHHGPPAG
ncbi:MAG: hypothetical protein R2844_06205 [Caldilineales bacterium]